MAFQRVYRFLVWKTDIYVLRSSVLSICQQPGVFSLPLFPSCLAPSSSCSSSTFGIFLLLHSSVHPSIFSLSHLFFFFIIYPLSPVSPFYLITYLFSTVDLFSSHRLYFRVRFLLSPPVTPSFSRSTPLFASPILLFSSASDLYPSFVSRRLSSTLSFFPRFQERGGFSFTFRHLKNFFRFHFLVCISSIFFSNHFLFPFFPYLFILFCSRMFLCLFILFFPVYSIY